jgi:hypothetical protein
MAVLLRLLRDPEARHGEGGGATCGSISVPWQRGHHWRCRSRTFHRVPQREHTWITRPA